MEVTLKFRITDENGAEVLRVEALPHLVRALRTFADEVEAGWYVDLDDLPNFAS